VCGLLLKIGVLPRREFGKMPNSAAKMAALPEDIPRGYSPRIFPEDIPRGYSPRIFPEDIPRRYSPKIFPEDIPRRYSPKIFPEDTVPPRRYDPSEGVGVIGLDLGLASME